MFGVDWLTKQSMVELTNKHLIDQITKEHRVIDGEVELGTTSDVEDRNGTFRSYS